MPRHAAARLLVGVALLAGPATLPGQSSLTRWGPEDRTFIGDFSHITSIATGQMQVFVTSPKAVVLWNPGFREWEGPYQPPTPDYLRFVFQSLVDPLDQSLWMATPNGWIQFQPGIQLWDRGTVPGQVLTIALDRANPVAGLFLRTSSGWFQVARGSSTAQPSAPPSDPRLPTTPQQAVRLNPALEANRSTILQTPGMGTTRYTAAAEAFDKQGWYIGTLGAGLLFLPVASALPVPMTFGLMGPVARALYRAPRGVWVATNETGSAPAALTFVRYDLRSFTSLTGSPAFGLRFHRVAQLTGHQRDLWVASDIGLVRVPTGGASIEVFDRTRGLPDDRVLSVASYRGNVVVGTLRGVALIDDSLKVRPVGAGFTGRAWTVTSSADTVWIGTDLGIRYALPGITGLFRPRQLGESPSFQVAVLDLAWKADTLVGMTNNELLWRDPATSEWALGPNLSGVLGRLHRLALYEDGFWIAGERGVAFATVESPARAVLWVGDDLPGIPLDLAVQGEFLWVGTNAGVVRWRLDAIRP